jgi:putative ABC transport system permease protein
VWSVAKKILLHDRVKFGVATAGVAISVVLVLVQIGLYFGFMETASLLIDRANADVWVTGEANENFDFAAPMNERIAWRIAETPGVASTQKMILAFGQMKGEGGEAEGVQVIGVEPQGQLLVPWNVVRGETMPRSDGILVDETESKKLHIDTLGVHREVSGARSKVVGLTHGIRSFTTSPYVWTNLDSARTYTGLDSSQVTYVLVKAADGVDPRELAARLRRIPNIDAYSKPEMSARAREYWATRTGVAAGFFTTAIIGVIVGIVVVGQILYSGTLEHLKEYGTLKAMGAANGDVVRVILYQALISATAGFVLGTAMAFVARTLLRGNNLTVALSPSLIVATGVLTALMCTAASLLSITKVLRLDPASVFKG